MVAHIQAQFLGQGPLVRNSHLTVPRLVGGCSVQSPRPTSSLGRFSRSGPGPCHDPLACPLNYSHHIPQVITCAMKEEKRSQMDMGDLSEDE